MKDNKALIVVSSAVALLVAGWAIRKIRIIQAQNALDEETGNEWRIQQYENYVHSSGHDGDGRNKRTTRRKATKTQSN